MIKRLRRGKAKPDQQKRDVETVNHVSKGPNIMDFVDDLVDDGNAKEFFITGMARVERLGANQVRLTRYTVRNGENVISHYDIMDIADYRKAFMVHEAILQYLDQPPPNGGTVEQQERRRGKH